MLTFRKVKTDASAASDGPSISFHIAHEGRQRTLVLSDSRLALCKGGTTLAAVPAGDVLRVVQDSQDHNRLTVEVLSRIHLEAEDANEVHRILDACRGLGLGSELQPQTRAEEEKKLDQSSGLQDYEIIDVLGEGSFGTVYKVLRKADRKLLAMKTVSLRMDHEEIVMEEKRILEQLDHPFIVKLHESFVKDGKLYMCMDYVDNGDLWIHLHRERKFTEDKARFWIAQVILALEYLHSKQIIFRDLKPENVMIGSDGNIKIVDLGLAKRGITSTGGFAARGSKATTFVGTVHYMAPEILKGVEHGFAVDWWSFGIMLYEMLVGQVPFYSENRQELYNKAIKGEIIFPAHVSKEAEQLIRSVLVRRPEDRLGSGILGVYEIKKHPFFNGTDWDSFGKEASSDVNVVSRDEVGSRSVRRNDFASVEDEDDEDMNDFIEMVRSNDKKANPFK